MQIGNLYHHNTIVHFILVMQMQLVITLFSYYCIEQVRCKRVPSLIKNLERMKGRWVGMYTIFVYYICMCLPTVNNKIKRNEYFIFYNLKMQ